MFSVSGEAWYEISSISLEFRVRWVSPSQSMRIDLVDKDVHLEEYEFCCMFKVVSTTLLTSKQFDKLRTRFIQLKMKFFLIIFQHHLISHIQIIIN